MSASFQIAGENVQTGFIDKFIDKVPFVFFYQSSWRVERF